MNLRAEKWPKAPTYWTENRILYVSIPFTWNLPEVKKAIESKTLFFDRAFVGGPAVELKPFYFDDCERVTVGERMEGVLQRVNPNATKTTEGCIRHCRFCAVRKIEGDFRELSDWPDLPVLTDNNLLAASREHFDRVVDRLKVHGWADFNQGLDARLLSEYHALKIAEIKKPMVRLALDSMEWAQPWEQALRTLHGCGISKANIRCYALIGFDSEPKEAWDRCRWIETHGVKVLPMWFHRLDAMERNQVTEEQKALGWTDEERKKIMQWFYQHRGYPRKKNAVESPSARLF